MKTILWTQNSSPLINDIVLVDGEICTNPDAIQEAMVKLNEINQCLALSPKMVNQLRKKHDSISSLNFRICKNGVYLQGLYENTDEIGRKLPYMFYDSESLTISEALNTLSDISKCINRVCCKKDEEILRLFDDKLKKKKNNLLSYAIALLTIITIIILWNCLK